MDCKLCRSHSPEENNQRFLPPEMREPLVLIRISLDISQEQKSATRSFCSTEISLENLIRTRNSLFRVAKIPDRIFSVLCRDQIGQEWKPRGLRKKMKKFPVVQFVFHVAPIKVEVHNMEGNLCEKLLSSVVTRRIFCRNCSNTMKKLCTLFEHDEIG